MTDRRFHILIIGTGKNAGKVISCLTEAGHTVSIVTSAPIMKAIHGNKYFIDQNDILHDYPCHEQSFPSLIRSNLSMFELYLQYHDLRLAS